VGGGALNQHFPTFYIFVKYSFITLLAFRRWYMFCEIRKINLFLCTILCEIFLWARLNL